MVVLGITTPKGVTQQQVGGLYPVVGDLFYQEAFTGTTGRFGKDVVRKLLLTFVTSIFLLFLNTTGNIRFECRPYEQVNNVFPTAIN